MKKSSGAITAPSGPIAVTTPKPDPKPPKPETDPCKTVRDQLDNAVKAKALCDTERVKVQKSYDTLAEKYNDLVRLSAKTQTEFADLDNKYDALEDNFEGMKTMFETDEIKLAKIADLLKDMEAGTPSSKVARLKKDYTTLKGNFEDYKKSVKVRVLENPDTTSYDLLRALFLRIRPKK